MFDVPPSPSARLSADLEVRRIVGNVLQTAVFNQGF